jgi:amidase
MSELTAMSLTAIAQNINSGDVSSLEVIDAHLQQIEKVNPALNAVVLLTADQARDEARAADAQSARGVRRGPLHGVPVTIKDCYDTEGIITTGGTLGHADHVPDADAAAVAKLKKAGAIVLGKTNCPEFCLAFETDNLVYGRTNNPYNLERGVGGSSGGEGAIVAAGGSPLGLGTDAGGSIRIPAHCNGVAGIRPTTGRVALTGIWPPFGGIIGPTNSAGPIARYVDDLIMALPLISGPDGHDPMAVQVPLADPNDVDVSKLRISVHTDNGIATPTTETIAAVQSAATALQNSGSACEEEIPAMLTDAPALMMDIYSADSAAIFREYLVEAGTEQIHPMLASTLDMFSEKKMLGEDVARALVRWAAYRSALTAFMAPYDVLLCPVCAYPALPHGKVLENFGGFFYTFAFSLMGWPVAVVRAGTSPEGLPIGVQIVAKPWREDIALAVAKTLEQSLGGYQPPAL